MNSGLYHLSLKRLSACDNIIKKNGIQIWFNADNIVGNMIKLWRIILCIHSDLCWSNGVKQLFYIHFSLFSL